MFICSECVKPEGRQLFIGVGSYGRCEICREIREVVNIHDYSIIKDKSKQTDNNSLSGKSNQ